MIKITPKTQKERFLCSIAEGVDNAPSAVTREEKFFAEILKRPAQAPSPITRYEKYLAKIAGHDVDIPKPYTRLEYFLAKVAGMDIQTPIPITREEMYWSNYAPAPAPTAKTIEGVLPLVFSADGNNLTDYTIYGASGGAGDYNSTTGKYDIPVTISGKNIIVNTLASQTYNGITLTRNSDGSVTLNGTAEASMNFSMTRDTHTLNPDDYQPIENAVYVISGSPEGAAVNKYMMSFRYVSAIGLTSSFTRVPTDGRTIDNTGGEFNYIAPYISVWSGITCNNVTFYPMLRKIGMGDEYEPPSTSTTVTLSVDSPLAAGQTLSLADTQIDLSTVNGTNEIVVGTTVKPSKVKLSGEVEFIREGEPTVYTISYYSQDGTTLLGTEYVEPEHNGHGLLTNPTKESTAQYNFTFAGWNADSTATTADANALNNVMADRTVYAIFTAVSKGYTVYFYNGETLLETVTGVPSGGTATYTGATPTSSQAGYIFSGWSPLNTNITADTSCYAQFVDEDMYESISDTWSEIIANVSNGTYSTKYQVGDTKKIDLGTEGEVIMTIVGIDTDDLADNSGKAPITWISKQLLKTDHRMNPAKQSGTSGTGALGGWKACEMRSYLINTIKPLLPSEVRNALRTVKKYSKIYNTSGTAVNNVVSNDDIWIPSAYEVNFTSYETSGVTYSTAFPDNASRIKHKVGGAAAWWWLRSANGSNHFRRVSSDGSYGDGYANNSYGVAVGFVI